MKLASIPALSFVLSSVLCVAACDQAKTHKAPDAVPSAAATNAPATNSADVKPTKEPAMPEKAEKVEKLVRSEEEWKKQLTAEEYYVLRRKGTERPFVNKYDEHFEPGSYQCAGCGLELFTSDTKFNSGCGWPAFYASKAGDRVKLHRDLSAGMIRIEVTCARCDGHLGHIFDDAPQTPTGQRYCINSVSIKFVPKPKTSAGTTDKTGEKPK